MSLAEIIQILFADGFIYVEKKELCLIFRHADLHTEHEFFLIHDGPEEKEVTEQDVQKWITKNKASAIKLTVLRNSL